MTQEPNPAEKPDESEVPIEIAKGARENRNLWLRDRVMPVISLIGAAISITMALFTVNRALETGKQLRAISRTQEEISRTQREAAAELKTVSANLTTKYVGEFPGCLEKIVEVLDQAQEGEQLTIVSDFPGYGIYSDHNRYLDYERVIRKKSSKIRMVVLNHSQRLEVLKAQFTKRPFAEVKGKEAFRQFVQWSPYKENDLLNADDLCKAIENEQIKAYQSNLNEIRNKCETDRPMPILLWIVGDRLAVFSIPNLLPEEGAVEAAFETRDHSLIKQLRNLADSYACTKPGAVKSE